MTTSLRLSVAALVIAVAAFIPANAANASGAWPPNPPPPKVLHIACWRMGGFCWIPVVM